MNYGLQNEIDFVEYFNDKYLHEFDLSSQNFLIDIFDGHINNDEKIVAWKNRLNQKSDFFIKYKTITRAIGLKCGKDNSIHSEYVHEFRYFLEQLRIPYKIIEYYFNYHYGYRRDENNKIDLSFKYSSEDYKKIYQDELDEFNKYLNRSKYVIDLIDRFIIKGRNSDTGIDVLVSGTINDYVWIKKLDIYDMFMKKRDNNYSSPHISNIFIGPKKRNLNGDCKNYKDKYQVCARWNTVREDIIDYKNSLINNDDSNDYI